MPRSRRGNRVDLSRSAILFNSDGERLNVTILDISRGGFRISLSEHLRIGERVSVQEGQLEMLAEIKWILGNEAGAAFLNHLDND